VSKPFQLSLADACDDIRGQNPHLGCLLPTFRAFVLDSSTLPTSRMSQEDLERELRILFRNARNQTNELLLARAQYSHAVRSLSSCENKPGFTRLDRKAIRLGGIPFEKKLKAEFVSALALAEAERVAMHESWREHWKQVRAEARAT
jgi:hypothetical protein